MTIFLLIPQSAAWEWKAHARIIDEIYDNHLPPNIKNSLDEHQMVLGAWEPDRSDLANNKANHKYPDSVKKAEECLSNAKIAYHNGNYKLESFYYGMASHYISDSFAAPHSGWMKTLPDKDSYYKKGNNLVPGIDKKLQYKNSINELLQYGYSRGKESIDNLEKAKSTDAKSNIVQGDLNRAYTATYLIFRSSMGF